MPEYQTYEDWIRSLNDANARTQTQEIKVEPTTEENPAVSKLREAFEVARNAIIDGSKLAEQVTELSLTVDNLKVTLSGLQRDLEYVRSRNKELDEQVTSVRASRDQALNDVSSLQAKLYDVDSRRTQAEAKVEDQNRLLDNYQQRIDGLSKERDDALVMALEYESKLKEAEAKLAKIEEAMHGVKSAEVAVEKPKPHWEEQPRDEVGKFQPTAYTSGSQSEGGGF